MGQRDLTYNVPNTGYNTEPEIENPFISPIDEESSYELNQDLSPSQLEDNSQINMNDPNYGGTFNNYNGYYSKNGTTSNLLPNDGTSEDTLGIRNSMGIGRISSSRNLYIPSEYDRYPSMAGSRVVSSTSLSSDMYNSAQNVRNAQNVPESEGDDSSISNKSTNPLVENDFSPFGGYPATSFPLHIDEKEPDDYLHNPDPIKDAKYDKNRFIYDLKNMDRRSLGGLLGVVFMMLAAIVVFILLPVLTYSGVTEHYTPENYEILTSYRYPLLSAIRTDLVDPDTPEAALTRKANNGDEWKLVFSDEFNADGRTFYEDDDQFFQAADIWYGGTQDLEYYDPDAVTTANGTLNLRMDAYKNHDLFYRSGMVQSWNKMCFTQGLLEISARLPGYGNISGLWPGLWTMGNLGRPGYMASTEGVWPYTYDSCDAGITANQSSPDGISYLPGQRLNKCTCSGEDHPSPGKGRGAPEYDVLEGEVSTDVGVGVASQSMQIAPFDIWYYPDYNFISIHNDSVTTMNTYTGGPLQQAVSGTTTLNVSWYSEGDNEHNFQTYGYEYLNDDDDGYLTWYVGMDPTVTVKAAALGPNGNIGQRLMSKEPMSLVMNFGISNSWAYIDWNALFFPLTMRIDHVRLYQPEDSINLTCDPEDYPTYNYIQAHPKAYQDNNLTSWEETGYDFPKNSLIHKC
ncbi:unnamed protein product [Debaryomyces tyrocola]|nr:unnamed protein product [Debaryomyces tyrocola]